MSALGCVVMHSAMSGPPVTRLTVLAGRSSAARVSPAEGYEAREVVNLLLQAWCDFGVHFSKELVFEREADGLRPAADGQERERRMLSLQESVEGELLQGGVFAQLPTDQIQVFIEQLVPSRGAMRLSRDA